MQSPKLTTCTCQRAPVTKNTHLPSLVVFFLPKDGGWKINFSFWGQRNGLFSRARSLLSGSVTAYNQLVELFTSPTEQLRKKTGVYSLVKKTYLALVIRDDKQPWKYGSQDLVLSSPSFGYSSSRHVDLKIPRVGRQHLGTKHQPETQKRSGPWVVVAFFVGWVGGMVLLEVALYDEF